MSIAPIRYIKPSHRCIDQRSSVPAPPGESGKWLACRLCGRVMPMARPKSPNTGDRRMRHLRIVAAILAIVSLTGCAASIRTIGQHDPTVEAIRALGEILKAQATPSPTPTPEGGR